MAAEKGEIEAVSRLIEAKCDVDKADVRPLSRCLSSWHAMSVAWDERYCDSVQWYRRSGTELAYGGMG
eukprot:2711670-Rhodomonas_salina.1